MRASQKFVWIAALAIAGGAGTAHAVTIVLGPGADVAGASSGLVAGDVLHLLPGTYLTGGFVLNPGVTLRGSGFDTVVQGFGNATESIIVASSDTTIEHLRFAEARHAVTIGAATSDVLVQSVLATDLILDALTIDSSGAVVRNNLLLNNFRYGIDIRMGASPLIENNTLFGNGTGVNIDHAAGTIRNNIIVNNVGGSGVAADGAAVRITNPFGVPATDPLIEYNLSFGNVNTDYVGYLRSPPPLGFGNIQADPLFVGGADPTTAFLLSQLLGGQASTSPAVDAGSAMSLPVGSTALGGAPDTGRIDMGYHSVPPAAVPEPSTGLLVLCGIVALGARRSAGHQHARRPRACS